MSFSLAPLQPDGARNIYYYVNYYVKKIVTNVYVFVTEIIWLTFDVIIDEVERLCLYYIHSRI